MKFLSFVAVSTIGLAAQTAVASAYGQPDAIQHSRRAKPGHAHRPSSSSSTAANASTSAAAYSTGGIGVASQGQSLVVDSHGRGAASSAIGPGLSSSNDTCMGSTSVGAAGLAFGLSLGSTYVDENCMMLKNARELWNMGFRGAAIARLCMDERNRQALETSGVLCLPAKRQAPALPPAEVLASDPASR